MASCLRRTCNFHKKFLISSKSYFIQYFSALSSIHGRNCNIKNIKQCTYFKINNPKPVLYRSFSLQYVRAFYDNLSASNACKFAQEILVETHNFTGVSWTLTIIAAAAALKLFIAFPCTVYQKVLASKLELNQIELAGMIKGFKDKIYYKAYEKKWTQKRMHSELLSEISRHKKILYVKNNCHPFKAVILFFIQLPFWLVLSVAIRKFAVDAYTGQSDFLEAALQFQVGGPFWSPNLTLPDPTFIIPTVNFLALITCVELSFLTKTEVLKAKNLFMKVMPYLLRLYTVMFFCISAVSPSGLSLFWASSTLMGLAENLLILIPKVRRFFKIPKTPSEWDKPFRHLRNRFLEKFRILSPKKE